MIYPGLPVLKPVKTIWGVIFRGLFGSPLEAMSVKQRGGRVAPDKIQAWLYRRLAASDLDYAR
jgi:hypothetical protein